MAFVQAITDEFGNTYAAAYTNVRKITIDWGTNKATVYIDTFRDKDARVANKRPVTTQAFSFEGASFNNFFSKAKLADPNYRVVAALYTYILSLPDYSSAVSDVEV